MNTYTTADLKKRTNVQNAAILEKLTGEVTFNPYDMTTEERYEMIEKILVAQSKTAPVEKSQEQIDREIAQSQKRINQAFAMLYNPNYAPIVSVRTPGQLTAKIVKLVALLIRSGERQVDVYNMLGGIVSKKQISRIARGRRYAGVLEAGAKNKAAAEVQKPRGSKKVVSPVGMTVDGFDGWAAVL